MSGKKKTRILGNENGRKIAIEGTAGVHPSQWYPERHPGHSQVPYLLSPKTISPKTNASIRTVWQASDYQGRDFMPFEISGIPNKYKLAQVLACGLKASVATYSQHWQGMYFDWTFNNHIDDAFSKFKIKAHGERLVKNPFATVVLFNTGYNGMFMDMLRLRRRPVPPSMISLENLDMGTFECNLRSAVGSVLGGHVGVNVIRHSLASDFIAEDNCEGYEQLKKLALVQGMNPEGSITCVLQIGFKQPRDYIEIDQELMDMAAAKIIERKSERRNADFSRDVPIPVMTRFFAAFNHEIKKSMLQGVVKTIVVEGNTSPGQVVLSRMRDAITEGLEGCRADIVRSFARNVEDGSCAMDFDAYKGLADLTFEVGQKVLKPREDGHRMLFIYIDLDMLEASGVPIDTAEQTAGNAIQAGLNSVHLDGTTSIPDGQDLRYGAFCLTGPIHSAELLDSDEQLERGWGQGFWHILAPELPPNNKMMAIVAISAKKEQDAFIAEKQAMNERKSVNEIFWYKTWNHPEGKSLNVPHWISYAHVLNVLPIPGNKTPMQEKPLPENMPEDHPIAQELKVLRG